MDEHLGRVFDYLKRTGQYEDTHIIFMSDNGAEVRTSAQIRTVAKAPRRAPRLRRSPSWATS
jgi:arylsulfatase A-like enzyme